MASNRDRLMANWGKQLDPQGRAYNPVLAKNVVKGNPRQGKQFRTFTKRVGGQTARYHEYTGPGGKRKVVRV